MGICSSKSAVVDTSIPGDVSQPSGSAQATNPLRSAQSPATSQGSAASAAALSSSTRVSAAPTEAPAQEVRHEVSQQVSRDDFFSIEDNRKLFPDNLWQNVSEHEKPKMPAYAIANVAEFCDNTTLSAFSRVCYRTDERSETEQKLRISELLKELKEAK